MTNSTIVKYYMNLTRVGGFPIVFVDITGYHHLCILYKLQNNRVILPYSCKVRVKIKNQGNTSK
jgi:hypothetical protein